MSIQVSVVAPAKDEAGNLVEFVERCLKAFATEGLRGEILIVDDGSIDETAHILKNLVNRYPEIVRGFRHRRNLGLTAALKTAFDESRGDIILWISPDLESHPDEDIPILIQGFNEGAEVVAGARLNRRDGKNLASEIYNNVCRWLFGLALRDMNWIKGFRRECLPFLHMRGDWHRFILVMLHIAGFSIVEKNTSWHARCYGRSKFGAMRFPRAFIDAFSVWFLLLFSRKPMRFFGSLGAGFFLLGVTTHFLLALLYFVADEQIRPLFWTALASEMVGVMLVMFGFVAELVEKLRDELDELRAGRAKSAQLAVPILPVGINELKEVP